jgi:hypothetical protein
MFYILRQLMCQLKILPDIHKINIFGLISIFIIRRWALDDRKRTYKYNTLAGYKRMDQTLTLVGCQRL